MLRATNKRPTWLIVLLLVLLTTPLQGQPTVWSGLTFEFSKPAFSNHTQFQDQITDNVSITRGTSMGIFNAVTECPFNVCNYTHNVSPEGTEWATDLMSANVGKTIAATNWQDLTFTNWESAYGDRAVGNFILNQPAVLHLIEDDIYLDIKFTRWDSVSIGAAFRYLRSEAPTGPTPTGDYNENGAVDAADYVLWRKTLNESASPQGSGADGNANGVIDAGDYAFWAERFGNVVLGSGASLNAVPEPAIVLLLAPPLALGLARRMRRMA